VIEADESDGTLVHYAPELAVIINIEFDHMEHFDSNADMVDCFRTFARQARTVIVGADDSVAADIGRTLGGVSFGFAADADIRVDIQEAGPVGTRFQITLPGGRTAMVYLPLTGRHNVLNAAAALAACDCQGGGDMAVACAALATFALPKRRFEPVAEARGIRVVADYAHHPSEIRAVIAAARQAGAARIWTVFQPHRYTRTRALGAEFPAAFTGVTGVVLLPVYAASEPPLAGGTSADLLAHFQREGGVAAELADDLADAADRIESRWSAGDWVLIVGAGDVEQLGPLLAARLRCSGASDSLE
jgi:UDP-N-acetylmuramate--alanine ligase